jgi:hypothetical protein
MPATAIEHFNTRLADIIEIDEVRSEDELSKVASVKSVGRRMNEPLPFTLITGTSSGIGRATAVRLSNERAPPVGTGTQPVQTLGKAGSVNV